MLEVNSTMLIQIVNFLLLIFLLNIFLYKPIRGILAKRNEEMNSMDRMIKDYEDRSVRHEHSLDEGAVLARKEGFKEKEILKGEGLEVEKGLLREASTAGDEKITQAKTELDGKIAGMRKSLEEQVSMFSKELAEKVLGRSIQ